MTTLNLHPEALEDLRKSGLTDETIVAAKLYTPAPGYLPRLLSRAFRVFPYLSVGSAERRCGKSRLMRLLCRVGLNAADHAPNRGTAVPGGGMAERAAGVR